MTAEELASFYYRFSMLIIKAKEHKKETEGMHLRAIAIHKELEELKEILVKALPPQEEKK